VSPTGTRFEHAHVLLRVQRSVELANRRHPTRARTEIVRGASSTDARLVDVFLRSILRADGAERAAMINAALRDAAARPELVHEDGVWRLTARADTGRPSDQLLVDAALAILDLMQLGGLARLGTCAAPACDRLRLDRSRNHSRVYCSVACANRAATTAYRARVARARSTASDPAGHAREEFL
jgi:predicted RNA-binding Zn ribbon-like protein